MNVTITRTATGCDWGMTHVGVSVPVTMLGVLRLGWNMSLYPCAAGAPALVVDSISS